MVGVEGFEPPTFDFGDRYSTTELHSYSEKFTDLFRSIG